ncbi:MAG: group II intron maturase-specific domain-containing protein, partial [Burkholderiales bacterium]
GASRKVRRGCRKAVRSRPCSRISRWTELDRELERRGLAFARHADDCNIYVASRKAGERVMASVTRFIERRLKLAVNEAKSAVDRPWRRTFLGFTLKEGEGLPRAIAAKSIARFKDWARGLTRRHRGVALKKMIADLNALLRGWAGYFGFSQGRELESLDGWIRRRPRRVMWTRWKTRRKRFPELQRPGVGEKSIFAAIMSPKGPWWIAACETLHRALRNRFFKRQDLVFMTEPTHA